MAKKKKVSKPKSKIVKPKKKKSDDFFLEDAQNIEKDMMDKGKVKVNKDLEKVW